MHAAMPQWAMGQEPSSRSSDELPDRASSAPHVTGPGQSAISSEQVIAALPAAVIVIDAQGQVCSLNPAAADLLTDVQPGQSWRSVIRRSFTFCGEHTVHLKQGQIVEVQTRPLVGGKGQVVLLLDVTPGRVLDALDHRQQRLLQLGEMVTAIAHQLRTPLAAARLHFSALQHDVCENSEAAIARRFQGLQQSYQRLEKMIDDMLVFARGGGLPMAAVSVADLLADLEQTARPLCRRSGVSLSLLNDAGNAAVLANREALSGVLCNLVDNAVQAMAERPPSAAGALAGCINVQFQAIPLGQDAAGLLITVADNGPGLSATCREHLFEPFFSTRAQGTGLGLAIARSLVQAHGGSIECLPQGAGTVFQIHLPVFVQESLVDEEVVNV